MNLVIKNTIRLILMMFIQAFIMQRIPPLHQFIVPYFYFAFILWLPFKISRMQLLWIAFLTGLLVDMFYKTPGLHAAASLLIGYTRPFLITLLLPKEATEWGNKEPTQKKHGIGTLLDLYGVHDTLASFLDDPLGMDAVWKLFLFYRKIDRHQLAQSLVNSYHRPFPEQECETALSMLTFVA